MVGVEKLVNTTGREMAKAQGASDYPMAVISHDLGVIEDLRDAEEVNALAKAVADQLESILIARNW